MLVSLLRTYLVPHRRVLAGIVVLQFIGAFAALFLPRLNADIIDFGVTRGDVPYILRVGAVMLAVAAVQIVCLVGAVYLSARTATSVGAAVRSDVFRRVNGFSAREMGLFGAPSLITRNTNDVLQVQTLIMMVLTMLVLAPVMCIGGIIMAVREEVRLAWLIAVSVPALALTMGLIIAKMIPAYQSMQSRIDAVNRVLREQITGVRVVRAFVREQWETARFARANRELTDTALHVGRLLAVAFPAVMLILNVTFVGVIWFGGIEISADRMQVGSLTAMINYLMLILMSIMFVTFMASQVPRAAVCAERISEVLATTSSITRPADPIRVMPTPGRVEFRDTAFCYPGAEKPVIEGISFTVSPGTTTAIIGGTGAGKSTVLQLIPRLIDATSGAVLVGGADVRDLEPSVLRAAMGYIPQRAYLFSGTIASNLRYGKPDATEEELWEALTIAQAADFVRAMPDGLESRVAQGGTTVSGGQRQRLAIARALVRKPDIYLFDDSFSALDVATDARLRAALAPHTTDAAVLIVGQRIATIKDADQILVLEGGRMVGAGTHDELLRTCAEYRETVESQMVTR
ncbi:ABC transporter ATP-binding protein/permease [Hoyosella sp. YIM 151337]|uniref:ABC transporter ATP-binding protein n=1 Tax=Hoyosella sp. YIM 151337 TaxID=2992742 RepID=UPI002235EFBB|nr:ABC transporter ATP-binding protein [Hoyosella sp. YIM 151337]MCW4354410.1 ABC transporter ATP-binding protein/permease [Hoyosella sp. YIM 151337]